MVPVLSNLANYICKLETLWRFYVPKIIDDDPYFWMLCENVTGLAFLRQGGMMAKQQEDLPAPINCNEA